jgi:hypothetical protein
MTNEKKKSATTPATTPAPAPRNGLIDGKWYWVGGEVTKDIYALLSGMAAQVEDARMETAKVQSTLNSVLTKRASKGSDTEISKVSKEYLEVAGSQNLIQRECHGFYGLLRACWPADGADAPTAYERDKYNAIPIETLKAALLADLKTLGFVRAAEATEQPATEQPV